MLNTKKENSMKENEKLDSWPRALSSNEKRVIGETSFRVYYGANGASVPFVWESQPGTPKHPIFRKSHDGNDNTIPPLTPPPSYTTSCMALDHASNKKSRKSRIFDFILSILSRKNSGVTSTLSSLSNIMSWSTTTSSSSSSISSPRLGGKKNDKDHRRSISSCSFGAKFPLFGHENHDNNVPPNSIMCFGFKKKKYQGCYSMQDMKNAILSIRGH